MKRAGPAQTSQFSLGYEVNRGGLMDEDVKKLMFEVLGDSASFMMRYQTHLRGKFQKLNEVLYWNLSYKAVQSIFVITRTEGESCRMMGQS